MDAAQTKVVFRVNKAPTAREMAEHLFQLQFNVERMKEGITMPVAIGQELDWLHGYNNSVADVEMESESEMDSWGSNTGMAFSPDGEEVGMTMMDAGGGAMGTARTRGSVTSSGSSASQTLRTVYEERAVHTVSLEEQLHEATARIRGLPNRHAIVYAPGSQKPFQITTEDVSVTKPLQSQLDRARAVISERSEFTNPVSLIEQDLIDRGIEIDPKGSIEGEVEYVDDDDDFDIPIKKPTDR